MDAKAKREALIADIKAKHAELRELQRTNPEAFPVVKQPDWQQSEWYESEC